MDLGPYVTRFVRNINKVTALDYMSKKRMVMQQKDLKSTLNFKNIL